MSFCMCPIYSVGKFLEVELLVQRGYAFILKDTTKLCCMEVIEIHTSTHNMTYNLL